MPGLKDQLAAEREAHRRTRDELERLFLLLADFADAASDAVQSGGDPDSLDMLKGALLRFRCGKA